MPCTSNSHVRVSTSNNYRVKVYNAQQDFEMQNHAGSFAKTRNPPCVSAASSAFLLNCLSSYLSPGPGRSKISVEIPMSDDLVIAGRAFKSRLIVGTGKYRSFPEMARAHAASGADMVTVAVRRVNLTDRSKESLLDYIDREKIFILPNTAACYTADEAIRTARLAREVGLSNWIKLEVIGDQQTLFPDTEQLIEATRVLVKEGFVVLPYTNDDLIAARKLIDAGAAAVMPLAAPIGSGLGIQNPANLRILRQRITEVPMIVDAGVGTASDAAIAMELGADGVLMNTAIAEAADAALMAEAMREAVSAGRKAWLAGRMPKRLYASASSPLSGVIRLLTGTGKVVASPNSACIAQSLPSPFALTISGLTHTAASAKDRRASPCAPE